ncbi:MAK10-like protein [Tanacetum coccineum]
MGDENPIHTPGDYSKPCHEGYRNTIKLPVGNNVLPLRSDTIWLVKNGCSFHGLRSEDPNQHLKDFLKLVDSLDLDGKNRERTRLRLFQFSLCDQASNWLERFPAGFITTWEDLTTRFLAQFFPPGRTAKLRNDILMFQQHHGESLSEAWTRFKDLLQKVPHHGIDLWLQVQIFYDHVNPVTRRTIDQSAGGKLRDQNAKESWALLKDLALYDNESWNDPRDFLKPVKAIALSQDVPSTSDRCLIELENQVQRLMEAHLALTQPTQVNKITTSCEICSGPYDTQYCMEDPEQAFVEYASSRTDEAGGKWYTFKPKQNNIGDTYNPSWRSHPNLRWRQPQNSQNNFSNPPNRFQPNGSIPNRSFNRRPQNLNNQSNLEGLVSEFIVSQDAKLSKFEADFKQQQSEMTNKIDNVLKAITDQIAGTLPSDTVKNPKLSTYPVLSARSYPIPSPSNTELICTKEEDGDVMFIYIIPKDDNSREEEPEAEGQEVEYFDIFLTRSELAYHKHVHIEKAYIDLNSPLNVMTRMMYNWIMRRKLDPRENVNGGVSNFTGRIKGMHVFVGNFTYIVDFVITEDISSIIDPRLSQVVLGKPFVEISNMTHDPPEGVVRFTNGNNEVAYKMPHKIEQYDSLSDLENEHTKSVYLRNEEDKRR